MTATNVLKHVSVSNDAINGSVKISVKKDGGNVSINVKEDGSVQISVGVDSRNGIEIGGATSIDMATSQITGDSLKVKIPGPAGASITIDLKPGGLAPHPVYPDLPPIPSIIVTPTISVGTMHHELPPLPPLTTDDFLDPEVPWSPLSGGLLGNAYRHLRHRQRVIDDAVDSSVNPAWTSAKTPPARDPLAIDLDGDGIETVGIGSNPVLFDHDGDGVKTGTGWLRPDDAWLVRDLDGNGLIDGGHELFGVDTVIVASAYQVPGLVERTAYTGFEALRALDDNRDGVFDAADAAWGEVALWRDLNSDGVSQADEIVSLASQDITGIVVNETAEATDLGNGNRVTGTAAVLRGQGAALAAATVDVNASNLDLVDNPFYRVFPDVIAYTEAAAASPEMGGSGWLRDLREAMSLGSAEAGVLQGVVDAFAAASTRSAQLDLLDSLLEAWADTTDRYAPNGAVAVTRQTIGETATSITKRYTTDTRDPLALGPGDLYISYQFLGVGYWEDGGYQQPGHFTEKAMQVLRQMSVLETFNGSRFVDFVRTSSKHVGGGGASGGGGSGGGSGGQGYQGPYHFGPVTIADSQVELIGSAYAALRESVYGALVLQTRLKPYLDAIELVVDETGVRFDTGVMGALLLDRQAADAGRCLEDTAELVRYAGTTLEAVGFDGLAELRRQVEMLAPDAPVRQQFGDLGLFLDASFAGTGRSDLWLGDGGDNIAHGGGGDDRLDGGNGDDWLGGDAGDDLLAGREGADTLYGGDGSDILRGGEGADVLKGEAGDDTLAGESGNDLLDGGTGNNVYLFGRGDGADAVANVLDDRSDKWNRLILGEGIAPEQVSLRGVNSLFWGWGADLEVAISGSDDKITFGGAWRGVSGYNDYATLQQIVFADGTVWGLEEIKAKGLETTDGRDTVYGTTGDDNIDGLSGDDTLHGYAGNDVLAGGEGGDALHGGDDDDLLDGGEGTDSLFGEAGNDTLTGGAGADTLKGEAGDDTLAGGTGNDTLDGGTGSNTYLFGRGDGVDTVLNVLDNTAGKLNRLVLGEGITPQDLVLRGVYSSFWSWNADLEVAIAGSGDKITFGGAWRGVSGYNDYATLQQIEFADGTVWGLEEIRAKGLEATSGSDTIHGTTGDDSLNGLSGDDALFGYSGNDALAGAEGNDALHGGDDNDTLDGGEGADSLFGGAGNDTLTGGAGADTLKGEAGDDTLAGGTGNDTLDGGTGSNTYLFGRGDGVDNVLNVLDNTAGKLNRLVLGEGITPQDLVLRGVYSSFWSWNADLEVAIVGTSDKITFGGAWRGVSGYNDYATLQQIEFADGTVWGLDEIRAKGLEGTSGNDSIYGSAYDDMIEGLAGNDTLYGGAGNDLLNGGEGTDSLFGEAGNDTLAGGAGADTLKGDVGDDTLAGGTGNDTLDGGTGNNTYRFSRGDGVDTVLNVLDNTAGKLNRLVLGEGITPQDLVLRGVYSSFWSWNADLEVAIVGTDDKITFGGAWRGVSGYNDYATLQQIEFADGTVWGLEEIRAKGLEGTSGADAIYGTAANDSISGLGGNDTLQGLGGNDTLNGGSGADQLAGGEGDDTYIVDNPGDQVVELPGQGTDLVKSSITCTLAANVENLTLTGSAVIDGTGNALDNVLIGNAAANALSGGAGADTLDGKAGADLMMGGAGDDTYVVDNLADVVLELAGEGHDLVKSSITHTLAANVENLTLTGSAVIHGEGNALDNVIIGNGANNTLTGHAGADFLDGKGGADTMIGGTGDDTYVVNTSGDVVTELAGEGIDTVVSSITYTLGANLENLTLTGTSNRNGTGNGQDNVLIGNAATNVLTGNAGNDTLDGGAGNDTLKGGTGSDDYLFGRGWGVDTIVENDATANVVDRVLLGAGITEADTSFVRNGNNLELHLAGSSDKLVVKDWYRGSQYQVEQFVHDSGAVVTPNQIAALVSAMASFDGHARGGAPGWPGIGLERMQVGQPLPFEMMR